MTINNFIQNKKLVIRFILLSGFLLTIVILVPYLNAQPEMNTLVRCDPLDSQVLLGSTFHFDIYIEDVEDLSGADVQLNFDPEIIQPVDADSGATGVQMQLLDEFLHPDFVLRNVIDEQAGTIWYAAVQINSPENPRDPANGSGPLARLTFEAQKTGKVDIPVTYSKLSTPDGFSIPHTAVDCSVEVIEDGQSFELLLPVILKD